jgi:hypothetical protein
MPLAYMQQRGCNYQFYIKASFLLDRHRILNVLRYAFVADFLANLNPSLICNWNKTVQLCLLSESQLQFVECLVIKRTCLSWNQ